TTAAPAVPQAARTCAAAVQASPAQGVNRAARRAASPYARGFVAIMAQGNAEEVAMTLSMPPDDGAVLARRAEIVVALKRIVPGEGVIASEQAMRPYESDGLTAYRQLPMVVVLPETTAQVSAVLAYCP